MIEKPKRPKKIPNQDNKQPQTIQELIRRYDLENIDIYDFLDYLVDKTNNKPDVVDNLESKSTTDALSAKQGKELNERIAGTVLYEDSTGTRGTVTLNETSANFSYIEIFYGTSNSSYNISTRIAYPNGSCCRILWTGSTYSYYKDLQISGTSITNYAVGRVSFKDGTYDNTEDGANTLFIKKVVGYR